MVVLDQSTDLSSTYHSFEDSGSTLDVNRARSDESLFWSAGEEAAVLVAELKASLTPPTCSSGSSSSNSPKAMKSHSYTNLSSLVALEELSSCNEKSHGLLPSYWNWSSVDSGNFTIRNLRSQKSRAFFQKRPLTAKPPKMAPGETFPFYPSRVKSHQLKTFGGSWRSLLRLGSISGRSKCGTLSAKKVPPPTVPETSGGGSSASSTCSSSSSSSSHRHSGSSYSSGIFSADQRSSYSSSIGGEEGHSLPPPSPSSPGKDSGCDPAMLSSISSNGSSSSNSSIGHRLRTSCIEGKSASPSHNQSNHVQFTFPSQAPQFAHLMCSKSSHGSPNHVPQEGAAHPYHPQYNTQVSLEDQGIDVQSPGRSSPGSGSNSSTSCSTGSSDRNCRNSTTSLDSGRASSSTQIHSHRLSGQSYDSSTILRHSYHSSNSSIGSSSVEFDPPLQTNVHELLCNGIPDAEALRLWLTEFHMEEHIEKFLTAGYDMPTISRMTPEDLNAIGITSPIHRKKLKTEISRLNISDCLPNFIPARLEEWLTLLRLEHYILPLKSQNYNTVQQVTQITWEDLEDVGIKKLGHQKKVMLAIKRVKDIMAGKKIHPEEKNFLASIYSRPDLYNLRGLHFQHPYYMHHSRLVEDPGGHPTNPIPPTHNRQFEHNLVNGNSLLSYNGNKYPLGYHADVTRGQINPVTVCYRPDVVAVNFTRNGNVHYIEEPIYGTCQTFFPSSSSYSNGRPQLSLQTNGYPQRSFDDGDITPTNENANIYEGGGGTLPRPRTAAKYRPVAKVTAKTRVDVHDIPAQFLKQETALIECTENGNGKSCLSDSANTTPTPTPISTPKKMPPPPPKRSHSLTENSNLNCQSHKDRDSNRGVSYSYIGVKSNLQPDVTPDMPPPPPAPQDKGNHQHLPEDFPPPPPPLTCITMASTATRNAGVVTSTAQNSGGTQNPDGSLPTFSSEIDSSHHSYGSDSESIGFRTRRNESNASFKSTSSSDSGESLPFANDNAGTIRQRPSKPHVPFASSPHSSPALTRRREGVVHPIVRDPPPVPSNALHSPPFKGLVGSTPDGTSDVLSDIGNMLATLTDELDAMLDQEMALKKQLAN